MSKSEKIPQQRIYHVIDTSLGREFLVKAKSREHAIRILSEPRFHVTVAPALLIAERMSSGVRLIEEEVVQGQNLTFAFDYDSEAKKETIAAPNGSAQQ